MIKTLLTLTVISIFSLSQLRAQDTVRVSLQEFINRGVENAGQLKYEREKVNLAENQVSQLNAKRYLPEFSLSTQHGVVPGVISHNPTLDKDEYYLDPNLENDWENWAIFTRAEINAVQPLFTWGALSNAVKAAESASIAAKEQFEQQEADLKVRLAELYQSYLLTREIMRLLDEASGTIRDIEDKLEENREEGAEDFDESDFFKFKIFKSEFATRATEVKESAAMTRRIWDYVLQADEGTVFLPESSFLDPVSEELKEINFYRMNAIKNRSEVEAIEAGIDAAEYGLKAEKSRNLPALVLGLRSSFANTPNRPRQSNPFIINNSNYLSASFGLVVRQNLDFLSINANVERRKLQYRQAKYLKETAVDGIVLEVNEIYKNTAVSKEKVDNTDEALVTSKKWLRQEQLDYDFGIGETKDLIDAMQKELELRVRKNREIFEFNKNMIQLHRKSGLPITPIFNNEE
ncbi:TolC family protein [Fodinibius sediminis]|uniref:Outer membrane protein TolC n=1 Tax=Fodinibius sediminis TaxID=1214077 RepID=A0A521B705_9BACT|nr:TolC family protein [Fodinibius sediminis]SMO42887.1 Outer membrane protein TolC [Fodinibius sediminis]